MRVVVGCLVAAAILVAEGVWVRGLAERSRAEGRGEMLGYLVANVKCDAGLTIPVPPGLHILRSPLAPVSGSILRGERGNVIDARGLVGVSIAPGVHDVTLDSLTIQGAGLTAIEVR